jgi:hypothetical protein
MKKHFLLLAILFVSALSFTSCRSDNDDEKETVEAFISYKYNNKAYTYEPSVVTSLNTLIDGFGTGTDKNRIQIWLPLNATVGAHAVTYEPSNENAYGASFYINDESEFYLQGKSGTITITVNNSTEIEGTFSFSGTTNDVVYQITEGSFKIDK